MDIENKDRIGRIRELNDAFRRTFSGGRVMMTSGVSELPDMVKAKALQLVASFDDFTEDNDPWGEHDCAALTVDGQRIIFKIDYFDRDLQWHSPDAADRVIVVVNLDPFHMQHGWIHLPLAEWGLAPDATIEVFDVLSEERYYWRGERNYVRLDPELRVAHILEVRS